MSPSILGLPTPSFRFPLPGLGLILLVVVLASCSTPSRIDTSSDQRMKATLESVRDSLPQERRAEFDQALGALMSDELSRLSPKDIPESVRRFKARIVGKTALEVIEDARKLKEGR